MKWCGPRVEVYSTVHGRPWLHRTTEIKDSDSRPVRAVQLPLASGCAATPGLVDSEFKPVALSVLLLPEFTSHSLSTSSSLFIHPSSFVSLSICKYDTRSDIIQCSQMASCA